MGVCILKIFDINTDDKKKNSATSKVNSSHRATSYVDVRNVWFSNEAGGKKMVVLFELSELVHRNLYSNTIRKKFNYL